MSPYLTISCFIDLYQTYSLFSLSRFDLELENFKVDVTALKVNPKARIFRAWIEDWEPDAIRTNDPVAMTKLLEKYKKLCFYNDYEHKMCTVYHGNLEWRRKDRKNGVDYAGWYVISVSENEDEDDSNCWEINQNLCDMIADQKQDDCIEVIRREANSDS